MKTDPKLFLKYDIQTTTTLRELPTQAFVTGIIQIKHSRTQKERGKGQVQWLRNFNGQKSAVRIKPLASRSSDWPSSETPGLRRVESEVIADGQMETE